MDCLKLSQLFLLREILRFFFSNQSYFYNSIYKNKTINNDNALFCKNSCVYQYNLLILSKLNAKIDQKRHF